MFSILPKRQMSEEDIKLNYITPAIQSRGWKDRITMETTVYFTDGKINNQGNVAVRGSRKKADNILYFSADKPRYYQMKKLKREKNADHQKTERGRP